MVILVSGDPGYIGSHTVHCQIQKENDLIVIDSNEYDYLAAIPTDVRIYKGIGNKNFINEIMDNDHQEEVFEYFREAETESIADALVELGEDEYSEEDEFGMHKHRRLVLILEKK